MRENEQIGYAVDDLIADYHPGITRHLHLTHYPTHSVLVTVAIGDLTHELCATYATDSRTYSGQFMDWQTQYHTTRESAERTAHFYRSLAEDNNSSAELFEHDRTQDHAAPQVLYAVRIVALSDGLGNPQRGWIITDATGERLGFVEEGFESTEPLRHVGAIELCSVNVTNLAYLQERDTPYPANR